MADNVRYVMILEIEKIVKKSPSNEWNSRSTTPTISEDLRTKHNVAKIVISDTDLNRLIARGGKHLDLVQDEEVDIK